MQNKHNLPGQKPDAPAQERNEQQSQSGSDRGQQGGQPHGKLTPSGGTSGSPGGNATQQSQSGGGRDQHGSNIKSEPGQARRGEVQQGGDNAGHRNKPR